MLFSSNVFLFLFLPAALIGYQILGRFGSRAVFAWLSLASLFFYGYWNPKYLLLLIGSIALNFTASHLIFRAREERTKSLILIGAICANLALLFWFKYLFPLLGFLHTAGWARRDFGSVVLPLGISFFTFTQIAYLVDLRESGARPEDPLAYTLFVTFFPHLIAGPIIHHAEMMPQFRAQPRRRSLHANDLAVGTTWFLLGLAKKVLIADRFGAVPDAFYAHPRLYNAHASWVAVLCYAIQLYFDFSGYSDMALGLARMFSITFPFNFNSPYKAASVIEFWQRWHITLTRYITTYLFNPVAMNMTRRRVLAGKKAGKRANRTLEGFTQLIAFPMIFTMFIAGIWHGAGLQFILFGVLHGVYLSVNHAWRTFVDEDSPWRRLLPAPAAVCITFLCVLLGQIFFRAENAPDAFWVAGSLVGLHHASAGLSSLGTSVSSHAAFIGRPTHAWLAIACAFAIFWLFPNTQEILGQTASSGVRSLVLPRLRWRPGLPWATAMLALTTVTLMMLYQSTSFLYFQF